MTQEIQLGKGQLINSLIVVRRFKFKVFSHSRIREETLPSNIRFQNYHYELRRYSGIKP